MTKREDIFFLCMISLLSLSCVRSDLFSLLSETEETARRVEEVSKEDPGSSRQRQIACQKAIAGRKERVS